MTREDAVAIESINQDLSRAILDADGMRARLDGLAKKDTYATLAVSKLAWVSASLCQAQALLGRLSREAAKVLADEGEQSVA